MDNGWEAHVYDDGAKHVVPVGDLRDHDHMADCWCLPTYDEGTWVHHSLDRREEYE